MSRERPSRHPTRKLRSTVPPKIPGAPRAPTAIALPGPDAVPRMRLDPEELGFVALDDESVALAHLMDGVRTVSELAAARGLTLQEARLRIADMRDRHVVSLD